MQKLIKRFSVVLIAAICAVCTAIFFVACDKEELATDIIYITVVDENGSAINGTTFGEGDYDPTNRQVQIQFCTLDGVCSAENANVGADGKAEFKVSLINDLAESGNADTVELHVLGVTAKGYVKEYGQYKVSKIPKNIKVTLKKG